MASQHKLNWRRIGVIVPSTNTMVENDFRAHAPNGVTVHAARMFLSETTAEDERRMISDYVPGAVRDIATVRPDVVVFACTSAGAVLGADGERDLISHIRAEVGVPVVSTNEAVAQALMKRKVKRPVVVTAYIPELTQKIVDGLKRHEIVASQALGMNILDPFGIGDVTPDAIIEFTKKNVNLDGADGIFVSCTNLRAFDAIAELEAWSGLPVVTSNQASLESAVAALDNAAA